MQLDFKSPPTAGRRFVVTVTAAAPGEIRVLIQGRVIREFRCPDPPCHEEIRIPKAAGGKTLTIQYRHRSGELNSEDLPISS